MMKKIFVIMAVCVGFSTVSMAQDAKGHRKHMTPEQRAEKQTAKMQEALSLTEAQKKAVYELHLQSAKDVGEIKKETREANREKFKAIRKNKDEKMKSILSGEQVAKYEAFKTERMNKMKERRSGGHQGIENRPSK